MTPPFNLSHLGGETAVTGSCHLMQFPGDFTLMVDCGSAMGEDPFVSFDDMPVKPGDIDCLFITHAHMDHIGRIPELIEKGFDGDIICTHPTKALLGPMLEDGLSFSDYSNSEKSKIGARINDLSWGFEYDDVFSLKHGITFKLGQAGHILGSCFIRFECPDTTQGRYSVIFSGDLGNTDTPILPDPATLFDAAEE